MKTTAYVQLARHGDIVSALPFMHDKAKQGREVYCYVAPAFASILEPASYVKAVIRDTHHRDIEETVKQALRDGHDEVIATQVDSNPFPAPATCANFIQEQWSRAGCLDRFHDFPLVFDRRDSDAEIATLQRYLPTRTAKPLLVYGLNGHSSPFPKWKEFRGWLRGSLGYQFDMLDLSELQLEKPHLLLPLIEAADVCLFSDSLPLHLSYAFCKPTFVLHRGTPAGPGKALQWWWSEPRRHWIGQMTYDQTEGVEGRRKIALAISEVAKWPDVHPPMEIEDSNRRIVHVVDWYVPQSKDESRRNLAALNKWEAIEHADKNWVNLYFEATRHAKRSSRDLGDVRLLPYLKDVIDFAMEKAGPDDIVCLTNADSCLVSDASAVLRRTMANASCCFSRRVQGADGSVEATQRELSVFPADGGVDLIAFKPKWWRENCHLFPDGFLIAHDCWDVCYAKIIRACGGREIRPPLVLHERHANFWSRPENLETCVGQKNNRWIYRNWAVKNGHSPVI